ASAVVRSSFAFQVVGYRAFLADDEASGLAEVLDEAQGLGFGHFISEMRDQKADESLLAPRAGGGVLPPVLQYLGLPFVQDSRLGVGFCLGLRLGGCGGVGCSGRLG